MVLLSGLEAHLPRLLSHHPEWLSGAWGLPAAGSWGGAQRSWSGSRGRAGRCRGCYFHPLLPQAALRQWTWREPLDMQNPFHPALWEQWLGGVEVPPVLLFSVWGRSGPQVGGRRSRVSREQRAVFSPILLPSVPQVPHCLSCSWALQAALQCR